MREGYRIRDVSPLSVISRIRQPVLFIHSKEDDYTSRFFRIAAPQKTRTEDALSGRIGRACHVVHQNPESYRKAVQTFLDTMTQT